MSLLCSSLQSPVTSPFIPNILTAPCSQIPLGHLHTHRLFAEVDLAPVVEFFTRTGTTLLVVSLILNAAQERCLYIEIGSVTCLCSYILGENTKDTKDNTGYIQF